MDSSLWRAENPGATWEEIYALPSCVLVPPSLFQGIHHRSRAAAAGVRGLLAGGTSSSYNQAQDLCPGGCCPQLFQAKFVYIRGGTVPPYSPSTPHLNVWCTAATTIHSGDWRQDRGGLH
jgi:hypothetical protein